MRILKTTALILLFCASAFSQMPDAPARPCPDCQLRGGPGMGGMEPPMPFLMNPDLRAACRADLGALGLTDEVRKALEAERFELQKLVIRNLAELKVLGMELEQSLASREFDLDAAGKKLDKIASTENKIREAHLKFLRSLGSKLDDKGWETLRGEMARPMPGGMQPMERMQGQMMPGMMQGGMMQGGMMQGGMMPCGCCRGPCGCDKMPCDKMPCDKMQGDKMPCDKMPCDKMQGGMMQGGMMQGGMMQGGMMQGGMMQGDKMQGGMMQGGMMQGGKMPCGMMQGEMKAGGGESPSPSEAAQPGGHDEHHPAEAVPAAGAKETEEFFKDK